MEADQQHSKSNDGTSTPSTTPVESVKPEELHKEQKPSRNPLKWFKNSASGASAPASDSSKSESSKPTSSSNPKAKPPLVVHYFPTGGRPGLS